MTALSILCVTNNEHAHVTRFILHMHRLATVLGAELVLGLDREAAQRADFRRLASTAVDVRANALQEDVLDECLAACRGEWVLRLDDDETVSNALANWLANRGHVQAQARLYAFPRVYLIQDEGHILVNEGMWPDLQTRLGRKELMGGYRHVHAGNPHGTGRVVPYALEHHKLLVRSFEERMGIAERYERCRAGAGSDPVYARYNVPERVYAEMLVKEYRDGDFSSR